MVIRNESGAGSCSPCTRNVFIPFPPVGLSIVSSLRGSIMLRNTLARNAFTVCAVRRDLGLLVGRELAAIERVLCKFLKKRRERFCHGVFVTIVQNSRRGFRSQDVGRVWEEGKWSKSCQLQLGLIRGAGSRPPQGPSAAPMVLKDRPFQQGQPLRLNLGYWFCLANYGECQPPGHRFPAWAEDHGAPDSTLGY